MNRNEAATILGVFSAAYPAIQVSQETAAVWMDVLCDIEAEDALKAARTLVKREPRFPTVSQLRDEAQAVANARRIHDSFERGLPEPPRRVSSERIAQIMGGLRAQLSARRGAGGHSHGGPEPCQACGGVAPPSAKSKPDPEQYVKPPTYTGSGYSKNSYHVPLAYEDVYRKKGRRR